MGLYALKTIMKESRTCMIIKLFANLAATCYEQNEEEVGFHCKNARETLMPSTQVRFVHHN